MAGPFYPGMLASLRMRFDDAFAQSVGLNLVDNPAPAPVTARKLSIPNKTLDLRPLLMSGVRDSLSRVVNTLVRSASVDLAPYRQAGTFTLGFDYTRIPVDPMLVRACAVEVYLDSVAAKDFQAGMRADNATMKDPSQLVLSQIVPSEDNLLFVGIADEWEVEHDTEGSWVRMVGRDLRCIFLDKPADKSLFTDLDLTKPIATGDPNNPGVVEQIIARHPLAERYIVSVKPVEWPNGKVPSPYTIDGVTRVRIPADTNVSPKTGKIRTTPKADPERVTFWDLITHFCYVCGAIPYFHGPQLRVRPVRPLYETIEKTGFDPAFPSPFATQGFDISGARDEVTGDPATKTPFFIRKMIFGRNIERLRITRKFNTYRPRIVKCVSLDTSSKNRGSQKLLIAGWDGKQDPFINDQDIGPVKHRNNQHHKARMFKTSIAPSGFRTDSEVMQISVPGIRNRDQLRLIAKSVFDEIGRGEVSGTCETKDLASYAIDPQGGNDDPDLLRLRPGDPVEFLTDTSAFQSDSPIVHTVVEQARASFDEAVKRVAQALGGAQPSTGDVNFAKILIASSRKMATSQTFFRVSAVKYDLTAEGLSISFDFQNYIEAHFDARADAPSSKAMQAGIGPVGGKLVRSQTTPSNKVPPTLKDTLLSSARKAGAVKRAGTPPSPVIPANNPARPTVTLAPEQTAEGAERGDNLTDILTGGSTSELD